MRIKRHKNRQAVITTNMHELEVRRMAKLMVINGENEQDFIKFGIKVLQDLVPQTQIEKTLCEKFIFLSWKLRRVIEHERNILNTQNKRLNEKEEFRIQLGKMSGRRVRNIKRIDMSEPEIANLARMQYDLDKQITKTLDRIRAEQNINTDK